MDYYKRFYKYFEGELDEYINLKGKEPTGVIIDEYIYEGLSIYLKLLFNYDESYELKTYKGIKLTVGSGLKLIYFY